MKQSQPLAGIVVIELGHSVAAPFAGQILADLGAEVIKIEKLEGDDARRWGPPFWVLRQAFSRSTATKNLWCANCVIQSNWPR